MSTGINIAQLSVSNINFSQTSLMFANAPSKYSGIK